MKISYLFKIFSICLFSSLLWGNAEELDTVVKIHAAEADLATPSDAGRKSIINEMIKYPAQLSADIKRKSEINIAIGDGMASRVEVQRKPLDIYEDIAKRLHQIYVSETDKNTQKNKLDKFFMAELIYPIVQNLTTIPLSKYMKDYPQLLSWQSMGDDNLTAEFIYSPDNNTLAVSSINRKILRDTEQNDNSTKKLILRATSVFDLESGKVKFIFSYSLDGAKKNWTDKVLNFAPKSSIFSGERLKNLFKLQD